MPTTLSTFVFFPEKLEQAAKNRDTAIEAIRQGLKSRGHGSIFSVKGGRGTSWGWISITTKPSRHVDYHMTEADRILLAELLDTPVHYQGESVPAATDYRLQAIQRAWGVPVTVIPTRYWD